MASTRQSRERIWLPLLGVVLVLTCIGSAVYAWGQMDWRPLIVTVICFVILAKPGA